MDIEQTIREIVREETRAIVQEELVSLFDRVSNAIDAEPSAAVQTKPAKKKPAKKTGSAEVPDYECVKCDKPFTSKAWYDRHMAKHGLDLESGGRGGEKQADKPYLCDQSGCGRSFAKISGLNRHRNETHGKGPIAKPGAAQKKSPKPEAVTPTRSASRSGAGSSKLEPTAPSSDDVNPLEAPERAWTSNDVDCPRCQLCNDPFWTKEDVAKHLDMEHANEM